MTASPLKQQMAHGWAGVGAQRTAKPVQHDPSKPTCPLCAAPAVAGYQWQNWSDLGHDCNCLMDRYEAYTAALCRLWRGRNALPIFLNSLPALYRDCTLQTLRTTPANRAALAGLKAWKGGNVYLYGQAGTGKTHLAVATVREWVGAGQTAKFWGMAALFKAIRDSFQDNAPRPELAHWDVLILDDIDKIRPTGFVYETFYEVLESRWANKKTTVFTAQTHPDKAALTLTPEGGEVAADPISSRMSSGQVHKFTGADERFGGHS